MSKNSILVTIGIVAYNHEKFISQAVDSVLMQKVNFDYEIIINDDASTDKTRDILKKYRENYPDKINLLLSEKNEGARKSGMKICRNSNGKYLTWFDGDDYWIYENKLQTQVDFLEANPEYNGCFHDAKIISTMDTDERSNQLAKNQSQKDFKCYSQFTRYSPDFYPWHLLHRNIIPTASLIFRNKKNCLNIFLNCSETTLSLNWALHLQLIKDGKFKYLNELWSVYNDHPEGISKKRDLNSFKMSNIEILKNLLTDDYYKYLKKDIYECMTNEYMQIMLNPETMKSSKGFFYKIILNYLWSCIKTAFYFARYYHHSKNITS
ncbi:MAG: glycosyltransferase [Bacteroidota bacterium]